MDVAELEQVALVLRRVGIATAGDRSLDQGMCLLLQEIVTDVRAHQGTAVRGIGERTLLPAGFVRGVVIELSGRGLFALRDIADDHITVALNPWWLEHIDEVRLRRLLVETTRLFIERFGGTLDMLGALLLVVPDAPDSMGE